MNANDPVVMNNDALHNDVEATTTESPSPFLDHEAVASVLEYGNPSMEPFGAGLAAGCRLLQNRYHLPAETALLLNAAVIATAVGPAARVRNPWGTDLSASLELTFCAGPQHTLTAAIADAFRVFRQTVSHKLQWREAAGSRRLRAEFVEILQALERVETELCRTAASLEPTQFQPPASFPRPDPKPEERLAHSRLEHQELLARREHLRGELAERRLDLLPFLVGEDPGWDTLQSLDKLAFDHCFTALSPDGATLRELLACSTRELRKITRLMQASRHGRDLTEGASLLLHPMLITLQVVRPELLRAALQHPGVRAGGFLDGPILEVLAASTRLEVEAFVEDADEKPWHELLGRLFIRRSRGPVRLYRLDRAGFNILEDFHQWCQQTGTAGAVHPESAGFLSGWPAMLLKLAALPSPRCRQGGRPGGGHPRRERLGSRCRSAEIRGGQTTPTPGKTHPGTRTGGTRRPRGRPHGWKAQEPGRLRHPAGIVPLLWPSGLHGLGRCP